MSAQDDPVDVVTIILDGGSDVLISTVLDGILLRYPLARVLAGGFTRQGSSILLELGGSVEDQVSIRHHPDLRRQERRVSERRSDRRDRRASDRRTTTSTGGPSFL
jgi:hypothetical protein